jgi:hypothetical protein
LDIMTCAEIMASLETQQAAWHHGRVIRARTHLQAALHLGTREDNGLSSSIGKTAL